MLLLSIGKNKFFHFWLFISKIVNKNYGLRAILNPKNNPLKKNRFKILFVFLLFASSYSYSQQFNKQTPGSRSEKCGTQVWFDEAKRNSSSFQQQYLENEIKLRNSVSGMLELQNELLNNRTTATITIPVVFHVVAPNQLQITDAMILAQLNRINVDFSGLNTDSVNGSPFYAIRGHSNIQFCLAKRTPSNTSTTGIVRVSSSVQSSVSLGDPIKYSSSGGSDAWDPNKYLNIWIGNISSNILGYGTFPGSLLAEQGVVVLPGTLPGGDEIPYNQGRTLTHELGHYFWLLHPWGPSSCADDFPNTPLFDDTPLQSNPTYGCPSGAVVTGCSSPTPPGRMYQNFMDYTDDACLTMFTNGQNLRADRTLTLFRPGLLTSNGCVPVPVFPNDAGIVFINEPLSRICSTRVVPVVTLMNFGSTNLTSVTINYQINGTGTIRTFLWSGNLVQNQTALVSLPVADFGNIGFHNINVYTSLPNNVADGNPGNDGMVKFMQVQEIYNLPASITEEFTGSVFPPNNWLVVNPNADMTWARHATIGKKNQGSAWFNDFANTTFDRTDDLLLPNYTYSGIDSIFMTFNLATLTKYSPVIPGARVDTLSVLLSKDCGNTFTTIYKKFGASLQTVNDLSVQVPHREFFPLNNHWRLDSLNLGQWLGSSEQLFQLAFRFHGNYENNIFIDDVTVRTEILPERIKRDGFILLPVPFRDKLNVWHYLPPATLRFVNVYNISGQLVWSKQFNGNAEKVVEIDLSTRAAGIYAVSLGYQDKSNNVTIQVVKQ